MRKILLIGWKDLTLAFRDRAALIMMLLAPIALTIGMGFVTGRLSGGASSGISHIPVVLVNQDGQQLGNGLVDTFQSSALSSLIKPSLQTDPAAARKMVDDDQARAAIIIPQGFTQSVIPPQGQAPTGELVQVQIYANPTAPTSVGIVKTILEEYMSRVEIGRVSGSVTVTQLLDAGLIQVQQAEAIGQQIGQSQAIQTQSSTTIGLKSVSANGNMVQFDILASMAPGIALMFLMYTVSNGGRVFLAERSLGTLPRLLVTPTPTYQILGGKVFGIFLTGAAQMLILIVTGSLFFQLKWGDPLGVLALVVAAVFAACGWGMIITAIAKTPGQVGAIGSAMMLSFGILGGSFMSIANMPDWFKTISKITPNAWGLDGFTTLGMGGSLSDIRTPLLALLLMGALLFVAALLLFNRRGLAQR
jgi:ABC-2 type transport system permease protein